MLDIRIKELSILAVMFWGAQALAGGIPNNIESIDKLEPESSAQVEKPMPVEVRSTDAITEADMVEYELHYASKVAGFNLSTLRSLKKTDSGYRIDQNAKASLGHIKEYSEFNILEGEIRSERYQYERSIMGAKRFHNLDFMPSKQQAIYTEKKGKKRQVVEIPEDVLDAMTYQLKIRLDLSRQGQNYPHTQYVTVKKKGLKLYDFEYAGQERIKTKIGEFNTIKLSRIREPGDDKKTHMWLAKDWHFVLIRIEHQEDGDSAQLDLSGGTVGGKPIKALEEQP